MVVSSAAQLVVGATIQGTGVPTGSRIGAISGTNVTMVTATGAPSNATVGGAQNLIFSSVFGSVLTVSLSASGDYATPQNIYNAGFGVMQTNLALRELFFPGGLQVKWADIVSGAVFDFQNWTLEFGTNGWWRFQESSILGELRGGYLVNGAQFIKTVGPTFYSNNWNAGSAGGSSMFENLSGTTNQGLFRMHNMRVAVLAGANASPSFSSARMTMNVENLIMDYQGDSAGANAGIGAAFGTVKNTYLVKTNGSLNQTNGSNYATFDGLIYTGNYQSAPQHKFNLPQGYELDGYSPQVLNSQFLGGFNSATLETYPNINLTTAGWGLNDLKTRYQRYFGPITLQFPRRVAFEFNDSTATNLTGVTLYIRSGSTSVVNAVQAGDYNANTQALNLVWTTNVTSYRTCNSFVDTIDQVAQIRKYGYIEQSTSYSLNFASYSQPFFMLTDAVLSTIDEATANAITTVVLDFINKLIKVSGAATLRQVYAKCKVELAKVANSEVANFIVADGDSANVFGGWTFLIEEDGVLNTSTVLKQFKVDGEQVTIDAGGVVNVPYQDADGLRVTVTNLDPEGFGITWFLRHRPTGGSSWTNVAGTGNTALILLTEGSYDVQVRAPGYDWESSLTLDTDVSLSLSAALRYQVSANNTPQWEMAFDSVLSNAFQFDAVANKVSVSNETGGIIQPGFAELYRATQRIQHLPDLVWFWTAPVSANATSQKILIPTGNPISMYLTDESTNSVKITCPIIHSDSGQSADDRVRGNPAGYSIILGSPATAESAGLQSAIVSDIMARLGGAGFLTETHSLVKVVEAIDAVPTLAEVEASTVLAKEASITALGSPMQALSYVAPNNAGIADIKAKVDTLQNTDISGLPSLAQIEASEVLAKASVVAAVKAKTDNLPANPAAVGDAMALTSAYDAAKSAASQASVDAIGEPLQADNYVAPDNAKIAETLAAVDVVDSLVSALPVLSQIEASTVLAKAAVVDAVKAKTDNLPANPAAVGDAMALTSAYDAAKSASSQASVDAVADAVAETLKAADYVEPPSTEDIVAEIERPNGPLEKALKAAVGAEDNTT